MFEFLKNRFDSNKITRSVSLDRMEEKTDVAIFTVPQLQVYLEDEFGMTFKRAKDNVEMAMAIKKINGYRKANGQSPWKMSSDRGRKYFELDKTRK